MPHSVIFVLMVEIILIVFTTILMAQPKKVFPSKSEKLRSFAHWVGMLLLCLTFCWSIVLGIVLATNDMIISI
jgi:integral membrane sensor domain MASE1